MDINDKVRATALAEIANPQLEVTKQFFAVHVLDPSIPIRLVDKRDGHWFVYLGIKDQYYYWVLRVEILNEIPSVTWGYCNPHSNVRLDISSDNLSPDMITSELGLKPTNVGWKDQPLDGLLGKREKKHKQNRWWYEESVPEASDLDDKLNALLGALSPIKSALNRVADKSSAVISIGHHMQVDYTWGWSLSREQLSKLAELGVEVDLDLYACGPHLPEE